jgi:hypothetical protein
MNDNGWQQIAASRFFFSESDPSFCLKTDPSVLAVLDPYDVCAA